MRGTFWVTLITIGAVCAVAGCSRVGPMTAPGVNAAGSAAYSGQSSHQLLGVYEVLVSPAGIEVAEMGMRGLAGHIEVKKFLKPPFCPDCLKFSNVDNDEENHILAADVTIRNQTLQTAADVRGIVMSNDPVIYLANPDDYTTLFDPDTPPDINPFRLFGKDLIKGLVGPMVEVTEHFEMHYDEIPFIFQTAVDAIWKANDPREPYAILNQTIEGPLGTNAMISRRLQVEVLDRHDDVGEVRLASEELGVNAKLSKDPTVDDRYYAFVANMAEAPAGSYKCLISASDSVTEDILYDYITIEVSESLGEWQITQYGFPSSGCPRDIALGLDFVAGQPIIFFSGGTGCKEIRQSTTEFTGESKYFGLLDIDPLVPGFSPYPAGRLDSCISGGLAFFGFSDEEYDDGFYTGPVRSLMVTLFVEFSTGKPQYLNPGDGDAGRIYPSNASLVGVDVTDGLMGDLYGFWADPDGVLAPEIYGLGPDYTRHDVFMGGPLPSSVLGSGAGKISRNAENIRAFDVFAMFTDNGMIYVLESDGASSEIELLQFSVNIDTLVTSYSSVTTIPLGSVEAVDLDLLPANAYYSPNPDSDTIAVLVRGPSGGYLKLFSTLSFALVEEVGNESEPTLPGTAASMDVDLGGWRVFAADEEGDAVEYAWII
jgi:hypothetical protein